MRRRDFIATLGERCADVAGRGAGPAKPDIAIVHAAGGFPQSASPDTYRFNADSFREGLAKAGFVEGRNVRIEERWAHGDYQGAAGARGRASGEGRRRDRSDRRCGVGPCCTKRQHECSGRLHHRRRSGPVRIGGKPQPSGVAMSPEWSLLSVPAPSGLRSERNRARCGPHCLADEPEQSQRAGGARGRVGWRAETGTGNLVLNARNSGEIDAAFEELLRAKADAFFIATDPILLDRREQIVSFATKHKLPAVYFVRRPRPRAAFELRAEHHVDVHPGRPVHRPDSQSAKPAEMPVMQPDQVHPC